VDVSSIPEGTYYGISSMGEDPDSPGTPWALHDTSGGNPAQSFLGGSVQTNIMAVPEPGTVLMTGVLALVALLCTRRTRRNPGSA
ncbi:MAG: PEP-CTERM sorting domain-containing protein, partial [Lentisphaeria bacterium]